MIFIKRVLIDPPEREEEELQRCKRSPRSRILRQRILIVRSALSKRGDRLTSNQRFSEGYLAELCALF